MPISRSLRNPPITEALIDIKVKARQGFGPRAFESLKSRLSERFPKMDERTGGRLSVQIPPRGPESITAEDLGLQGYFFKTGDEKLIAQFRVDGFTLNRLSPYHGWDEILPVALDLWEQYADVAAPDSITRIAVRYINHVPLPLPLDFDEYLRSAPVIPESLPQTIGKFFSRVTIIDEGEGIAAHVVQTFEPDAQARAISLLLDIDVFRMLDSKPTIDRLARLLQQLREFKNAIFFSFLTDKALRQFE